MAHCGGGVMIWVSICYRQRTQGPFIDGLLNAKKYCGKILRSIVVQYIQEHHRMLQHDEAGLHVARICTQLLETEDILGLT